MLLNFGAFDSILKSTLFDSQITFQSASKTFATKEFSQDGT
jgi:hypothetical protein